MNPILTIAAITLVNMKNAEHVQFHTNILSAAATALGTTSCMRMIV